MQMIKIVVLILVLGGAAVASTAAADLRGAPESSALDGERTQGDRARLERRIHGVAIEFIMPLREFGVDRETNALANPDAWKPDHYCDEAIDYNDLRYRIVPVDNSGPISDTEKKRIGEIISFAYSALSHFDAQVLSGIERVSFVMWVNTNLTTQIDGQTFSCQRYVYISDGVVVVEVGHPPDAAISASVVAARLLDRICRHVVEVNLDAAFERDWRGILPRNFAYSREDALDDREIQIRKLDPIASDLLLERAGDSLVQDVASFAYTALAFPDQLRHALTRSSVCIEKAKLAEVFFLEHGVSRAAVAIREALDKLEE